MTKRLEGTGPGGIVLYVLAAIGIALAIARFALGIGAVSNLNQGYPWGFWIAFDVLAGIALAAGGFVVAGLVHIFGGEKYHALVRSAIVTAFLGYLLFIFALLIDLGRPWVIWHLIIFWQHESPMFEVGWCVMLYTAVLFLEFIPLVLEKLKMHRAMDLWRTYASWAAWGLLVLFAIALTQSLIWVVIIGGVLLAFEVLVRKGFFRRDPRAPTLLIMAGVIFSTLHQSSLGTLFTLVPHKLASLWYSPFLPVLFFISAVMTGLAMVIVESLWGATYLKRKPELHLLSGIGRALGWVVLIYVVLRAGDLLIRGGVAADLLVPSWRTALFWVEIGAGLLVPLVLLLNEEIVTTRRGLLISALFVVGGVLLNRYNVAVTGIQARYPERYVPHIMEIAISLGVVAVGILVYRWVVRHLPVMEPEHPALASESPAHPIGR